MDIVQKPSDSECYTASSEPFRFLQDFCSVSLSPRDTAYPQTKCKVRKESGNYIEFSDLDIYYMGYDTHILHNIK
jgi:hypothetical protein